ncbi:MAG: hypothetical protein AAGC77_09270 [Pseudomonadota bacterium]
MSISDDQKKVELRGALEKVSTELDALKEESLSFQESIADLLAATILQAKDNSASLQELDRLSQRIGDISHIIAHLEAQTPNGIKVELESALSHLSLRTVAEKFRDAAETGEDDDANTAPGELALF